MKLIDNGRKMTTQIIQSPIEMHDSMNQSVSYVVVYGLVPELKRTVIPESTRKLEFDEMRLSRIDITEVHVCKPFLSEQLAAYEARVFLRRLQGNPDLEGEVFLISPFYERAREQAEREERIR